MGLSSCNFLVGSIKRFSPRVRLGRSRSFKVIDLVQLKASMRLSISPS